MDRSYSEYQSSIYKIPPILFGQLVSFQSHIGNPSNVAISRVLSDRHKTIPMKSPTWVSHKHCWRLQYICTYYTASALLIKWQLLLSKSVSTQKIRQTLLRTWFCILLNNKKVRHMVPELDKEEHSQKTYIW